MEISKDQIEAKKKLDKVYSSINKIKEKYDLILCFHVVEHLFNLKIFSRFQYLLNPNGNVIIEVPNHSGHRYIKDDKNEEHNFSFSLPSIAILASKNKFEVKESSVGNYESPAYSDCLRVCLQKRSDYLKYGYENSILNPLIKKDLIIFGLGGDFKKYILPKIKLLSIIGYFSTKKDEYPNYINKDQILSSLCPYKKNGAKILVSSLKYEDEIKKYLTKLKWPKKNIYYLGRLLSE